MSVDPAANAQKPAWWGTPIEQLDFPPTTTSLLRQTGILECHDFLGWSEAELQAWAFVNSVSVWPILVTLGMKGIRLAPNERPDRLVRLVLAPANHVARQAVIEYYGLLGYNPAESPTEPELLEQRLAEGRPRIKTLKRLVPHLLPVLAQATAGTRGDPARVARAIAPMLGAGQTRPLHFAQLLLDVVSPKIPTGRADSTAEPGRQDRHFASVSDVQSMPQSVTLSHTTPQDSPEKSSTGIRVPGRATGTARPAWIGTPIGRLGLNGSTNDHLEQAGILRGHDFTDWSSLELEVWAAGNEFDLSPIQQALAIHSIPLAPNERPDQAVRLLLAPLNYTSRQLLIRYYGLLGCAPEGPQRLMPESKARSVADGPLFSLRFRLQALKQRPLALARVLATALAQQEGTPEELASAIAPLLGDGQTPPLHVARLLLDIVSSGTGTTTESAPETPRRAPVPDPQMIIPPDTSSSQTPLVVYEKTGKAVPAPAEVAETETPRWTSTPIEQLGLRGLLKNRLQQAGIRCGQDFTDWSMGELEVWGSENRIKLSPILRALTTHAITMAPDDRPDKLVRLLLAPLNSSARQLLVRFYGLLGHAPETLQEIAARSEMNQYVADGQLFSARFRLKSMKHVPPPLMAVIAQAVAYREGQPEDLAPIIAPLLGPGMTLPLHFARLLLEVVHRGLIRSQNILPSHSTSIQQRTPVRPEGRATPPSGHELGQRAESTRAATDLIDLLFNQDEP